MKMPDALTFVPLSFASLDPNIVVENLGQIYRFLPAQELTERWKNTRQFILTSPLFKELMERGYVVRHQVDSPTCLTDGSVLVKADRIHYIVNERYWTRHMHKEQIKRTVEMLQFMESSPLNTDGFYAADCHSGNAAFSFCEPIYIDLGSFTNFQMAKAMALSHIRKCLCQISLDASGVETFQGFLDMLAGDPQEASTEWDNYQAGNDDDPELGLIMQTLTSLGGQIMDVFEAGAASGRMTLKIAASGRRVVAVDTTPKLLNILFDHARANKLQITCVCHDLCSQIPPDTLRCDMVLASSITHHLFRHGLSFDMQAHVWNLMARKYVLIEYIDPLDVHVAKWGVDQALYNRQRFIDSFLNTGWKMEFEIKNPMPNEDQRKWFLFRRA